MQESQVWWVWMWLFRPIIPATLEAEAKGSQIQEGSRKVSKTRGIV
jgi:hypothetical protein